MKTHLKNQLQIQQKTRQKSMHKQQHAKMPSFIRKSFKINSLQQGETEKTRERKQVSGGAILNMVPMAPTLPGVEGWGKPPRSP